jgi:hypothetical protein
MSEMVERVARASFAIYCKRNELSFTFENMDDYERDFAMEHARACIEAMREPTKIMVYTATKCGDSEGYGSISEWDARNLWEEMIDTALTAPSPRPPA